MKRGKRVPQSSLVATTCTAHADAACRRHHLLGAGTAHKWTPDMHKAALAGQHVDEAAEGLDTIHLDIPAQGSDSFRYPVRSFVNGGCEMIVGRPGQSRAHDLEGPCTGALHL
jgi:hypothetical protein